MAEELADTLSSVLKLCGFQTTSTLHSFIKSMFLFEILVNNNSHFTFIMTENSFSQTNPINMNTVCCQQQTKERGTAGINTDTTEEEQE